MPSATKNAGEVGHVLVSEAARFTSQYTLRQRRASQAVSARVTAAASTSSAVQVKQDDSASESEAGGLTHSTPLPAARSGISKKRNARSEADADTPPDEAALWRGKSARMGGRKGHVTEKKPELASKARKLVALSAASAILSSAERVEATSTCITSCALSHVSSQHFVGAHVSAAGGLDKAVFNAKQIGCRAFALFLKSQRQWAAKPLEDDMALKFKKACEEHGYPPHLIVPHGSYLLNCGSADDDVLCKSRATLVDELQRCEKLGLLLYNFHPGSTCGDITTEECIARIAESIDQAHSQTTYVVTVIENMSCQGHTIGGTFEELASIIDKVKDKSRMGVCIDTCHAYAAGYDLSTEEGYEAVMKKFETVVGLKYLKAMHLNDSKGTLGCRLDRHANIGKGCIGKNGFLRIMNDPRLANIPLIMETPFTSNQGYSEEIQLLYSLCSACPKMS